MPKKQKISTVRKPSKNAERILALQNNPDIKSFKLPDTKKKTSYSRYGAKKCEINGIVFASIMEGMYYAHLLELRRKKFIKSFEMQKSYILMDGFTHKATGKKIRPITYIADFVITESDGKVFVVDIKGKKTPEFRIKEKLFMNKYPNIEFFCVQWDDTEKEWRNLDDIEKDKRTKKRERTKK